MLTNLRDITPSIVAHLIAEFTDEFEPFVYVGHDPESGHVLSVSSYNAPGVNDLGSGLPSAISPFGDEGEILIAADAAPISIARRLREYIAVIC